MHLTDKGCEDESWMKLAQDRVHWRVLMQAVSCQRRTQIQQGVTMDVQVRQVLETASCIQSFGWSTGTEQPRKENTNWHL